MHRFQHSNIKKTSHFFCSLKWNGQFQKPQIRRSLLLYFPPQLYHRERADKKSVSGQGQLSAAPAMPCKSPSCVTSSLLMLQCTIVNGVHPRSEGELLAKAAFRDTSGSCQAKPESNSQGQPEQ